MPPKNDDNIYLNARKIPIDKPIAIGMIGIPEVILPDRIRPIKKDPRKEETDRTIRE